MSGLEEALERKLNDKLKSKSTSPIHSNNDSPASYNSIIALTYSYLPKTPNKPASLPSIEEALNKVLEEQQKLTNKKISQDIISNTDSSIPKIIHRVWMTFDPKNPEMPERLKQMDVLLKNLHPDWKFIEWDDAKSLNFVRDYYPGFYQTYISYEEPVKRHDSFRYLVLKAFGGAFIQHEFVFQKNIESLLGKSNLVFSTKMLNAYKEKGLEHRKDELANNFMASTKNHAFWDLMINKMIKSANQKVMSATGPYLLTSSLKDYQESNSQDKSITILEPKYLYPFYASERNHPSIKENCISNLETIDKLGKADIKQCFKIFPDVYAYCPWRGSWNNDSHKQAKVNLELLNNNSFVMYDKLYVMSIPNHALSIRKLEKTLKALEQLKISYEVFPGVLGYKVKITDSNGNTFLGRDIKSHKVHINIEQTYAIECDNGVHPVVKAHVKGNNCKLSAGNFGTWCAKIILRKHIEENKFNNVVIFEDDFSPTTDNFAQKINTLIVNAQKYYDVIYLDSMFTKGSITPIKGNDVVSTVTSNAQWHGEWAHMMSYSGAAKLNQGMSFLGCSSDSYTRLLYKDPNFKTAIGQFNSYWANANFSSSVNDKFSGHNKNSLSTQMGCREYHPSNKNDCNYDIDLSLPIYLISPETSTKWTSTIKIFEQSKIFYKIFIKSDINQISIINLNNNKQFIGNDISKNLAKLNDGEKYLAICNPENEYPVTLKFIGQNQPFSLEELGKACTQQLLLDDAQNNGYAQIIILKNPVSITSDFNKKLNLFIDNLPQNFQFAYLEKPTSTGKVTKINDYVCELEETDSSINHDALVISNKGITNFLSIENYTTPLDLFDINSDNQQTCGMSSYVPAEAII